MRTENISKQDENRPLPLGVYKKMKATYNGYHLVQCDNKTKLPFRFIAKDDEDARGTVECLNWEGKYKLYRINMQSEERLDLIGIFQNRAWVH